jgi:TonB family protein
LPLKLISTESSLDVQLGNDGQVVHLGNLQSLPANFVQRQRSPDEMSQVKIPELKTLAVREFPALPLNAMKVRVSSGVANAMLVKKVNPVYPQDAKDNRIQGAVVMKLTIGKDGGIKDLQLISGHPALSPAAIETVKKWEFKPYLLQGEPVEVETSVTINFTLSR